jgi:hypothetical protein
LKSSIIKVAISDGNKIPEMIFNLARDCVNKLNKQLGLP